MTQPFYWLNKDSRTFLQRGYLASNQSAEDRIWEIAQHAERLLKEDGFAKKFYQYMSQGWYSLSSPVWSNYGTNRGLPVSCFGSYVEDSVSGILDTHAEVGMMTKLGGGTSAYWGEVRPRGSEIGNGNGQSFGSVHFMELFEKLMDVISQGSVRRGAFSPYLPIDHPDIEEFIGIGSDGHKIHNMTHGVTVSDNFINQLKAKGKQEQQSWLKLIENRNNAGLPYILFSDTINRNTVDVYRDKGMRIHASNLCSEIALPSSPDESFVCVLASMNLLHYDEWKNTDAVKVMIRFLDTVVTEFLNMIDCFAEDDPQIKYQMRKAYNFAERHRALGLGVLGFHSLLQSKMLSYEDSETSVLNLEIFKHIQEQAVEESEDLAKRFGEPELLEGYGRRNTTLTAIAPTKSSAFILGQVSRSIEPYKSNHFIDDSAKMKITFVNPYLKQLLQQKGLDDPAIWQMIKEDNGSVQNLYALSDHERDVFKAFHEIDPYSILDLAAIRQNFIDQSQSLNLSLTSDWKIKNINKLYLSAHSMGIKSLYYQFSKSAARELARKISYKCCEA